MDLTLKDKSAVVTGASRGIGLALAQALADTGVKVVAVSRSLTSELVTLLGSHDHVVHERVDLASRTVRAGQWIGPCRSSQVSTSWSTTSERAHPGEGFLSLTDDEKDSA